MAEEEFYDGLDSFEEEMFQTALVRGEKQNEMSSTSSSGRALHAPSSA
jgi:hypothetical protein